MGKIINKQITKDEFANIMQNHEENYMCIKMSGCLDYLLQFQELGFCICKRDNNGEETECFMFTDLTKDNEDFKVYTDIVDEIVRRIDADSEHENIEIELKNNLVLHIYNR